MQENFKNKTIRLQNTSLRGKIKMEDVIMKYYEKLLDMKCFSLHEIQELVGGNCNTAKSLLRSYIQRGYVEQVRKNLYVTVSLESGAPVATPYQIAGKITPTSYVSHRSAFIYYGYANQVSYEINVSSSSKFNSFEFDGLEYSCIASRISEGIIEENQVRIADRERSVIDYINDFDRIGGLEELLKGLEMMTYLSEEKLLRYLQLYNKAILYQKAGYILEHFRKSLKLSDEFFEVCQREKGKSVRYFSSSIPQNNFIYNSRWGLMVPEDLLYISA